MKRTFGICGIALLTTLCLAQGGFKTIMDSSKSFIVKFIDFSLTNLPNHGMHLELASPKSLVYAASKKQGIELYAPRLTLDAISTNGKEANAIQHAAATGGVRAVKSGLTGRSEMTGSSSSYDVKGGRTTLVVKGPVKLTSLSGDKQSFIATGSLLTADLGDSVGAMPLRTAVLSGPVHISIRQAAVPGNEGGNVKMTAGRLRLDEASKPATMTLDKGVEVNGTGTPGSLTGKFNEIVLTLNERGEVVKMSGAGG